MPKLDVILTRENLEEIKNEAGLFGLENVRILRPFGDMKERKLYLLARKKNNEEDYPTAYETVLMEKLGCKVEVVIENQINSLYKQTVAENNSDLSEEAINRLFDNALKSIEVDPPVKDINFERAKNLAKRIQQKNEQKKESSEKVSPVNQKKKIESLSNSEGEIAAGVQEKKPKSGPSVFQQKSTIPVAPNLSSATKSSLDLLLAALESNPHEITIVMEIISKKQPKQYSGRKI